METTRMETTQASASSSLLEHQKGHQDRGTEPYPCRLDRVLHRHGCLAELSEASGLPQKDSHHGIFPLGPSAVLCSVLQKQGVQDFTSLASHTSIRWKPWHTERPHLPAVCFSPEVKMFRVDLTPSSLRPAPVLYPEHQTSCRLAIKWESLIL